MIDSLIIKGEATPTETLCERPKTLCFSKITYGYPSCVQ